MSILSGKHILLGVTGGIAAYKSAFLVRLLKKAGALVKVVMTPESEQFITPLTLSTLSENPVVSSFTDEEKNWNNHVELGLWADVMLIAPATANTLSKMASGTANNLLITTYLSAKCPVYFAPAMDLDMYKHASSKASIDKLIGFGNKFIKPGSGELASGLVGEGRMAEPEDIISFIEQDILSQLPLAGKEITITAGPTYEAIDPVRFIGNHSSGKMGFELAKRALDLGAKVNLITGPTHLHLKHSNLTRIDVVSAQEMFDATLSKFDLSSVVIASAAVSDYRPKHPFDQKMKKSKDALHIELEPTTDILMHLGSIKKDHILVGFALETNDEEKNAKSKLKRKNLDFIVLNSLNDQGAGFKTDTNKITLITNSETIRFKTKPKSEVAKDIFDHILKLTLR
ncbi:bifunctional phosphopantothenoylcysteine decarboxylase/phosphopantothenate--cysteine ligase CoaBC [Psychroflexus gondwanensis]|uniref:Coenzyme A biosynthesis bifunctional protein CoaBC n=1 Tax=Psychroflexus gondwanensis ACAM 44 TaxID=1189619 RepID=N1WXB9_9FLAO|nr:bifunctional phosphopantothenoylcysteine decarboxylase/phosphopantothenate--cysteine ligase CoaBC [Psychroflexus gondwanensis]EMY81847.1 phosphopantothenoylcysteine decarboxylase/ phosphopantothenoylcysteine synthetase CoaBC [Psychroflexus gondwanensis ACAM 44]TXE19840.1 bifunctional phosphopantothenoylcysteine decarboxylase/phosphopantothenate--cysteine ligase CoaBC [Psychroflexus gondwanensis]